MSFPTGWTRSCALVVQHGQVTADQTAFPVLITEACLPAEMLTTGDPNAAQSDGGDIRFSSDVSGTTQLACEVVLWTQNANPLLATAEIWAPRDILTASDVTIYVWYAGGGGLSQPAAGASYGSQEVWGSSHVGRYHAQTIGARPSGTTADSTSSVNTLTNSGSTGATAVAGKIGNGGSFNGSDTQVGASVLSNFPSGSQARTLSGWFKRNANTAAQMFFGYGNNSSTGNRFGVYWQNDGKIYAECRSCAATFLWTADTSWHHIAIVLPSGTTTSSILMYLDGVSKSVTGDGTTLTTAASDFYLGRLAATATAFYDGLLDEIDISNVGRSASWIATEYNNQNSPSTFVVAGTPGAGVGGSAIIPLAMNHYRQLRNRN